MKISIDYGPKDSEKGGRVIIELNDALLFMEGVTLAFARIPEKLRKEIEVLRFYPCTESYSADGDVGLELIIVDPITRDTSSSLKGRAADVRLCPSIMDAREVANSVIAVVKHVFANRSARAVKHADISLALSSEVNAISEI